MSRARKERVEVERCGGPETETLVLYMVSLTLGSCLPLHEISQGNAFLEPRIFENQAEQSTSCHCLHSHSFTFALALGRPLHASKRLPLLTSILCHRRLLSSLERDGASSTYFLTLNYSVDI